MTERRQQVRCPKCGGTETEPKPDQDNCHDLWCRDCREYHTLERRKLDRRKIKRAIGEHGCWNDRKGSPQGRACVEERYPNSDRRQASGAARNVAPPENTCPSCGGNVPIVATITAGTFNGCQACGRTNPNPPEIDEHLWFSGIRKALLFINEDMQRASVMAVLRAFANRYHPATSCETTAAGEGLRPWLRHQVGCAGFRSSWPMSKVADAQCTCGLTAALASVPAPSPTRTQPATEATERERCRLIAGRLGDSLSGKHWPKWTTSQVCRLVIAIAHSIEDAGYGGVEEVLPKIHAELWEAEREANHRAATLAAEKEGEWMANDGWIRYPDHKPCMDGHYDTWVQAHPDVKGENIRNFWHAGNRWAHCNNTVRFYRLLPEPPTSVFEQADAGKDGQ